MYDVIIIGSGPAGLTAAIYAGRAMLSALVCEKDYMGTGQISVTDRVENYPGLYGINGYDLGEKFREQAETLGAEFYEGEAESFEKTAEGWKVIFKDGSVKEEKLLSTPQALHIVILTWQAVRNSAFLTAQCATASSIRIKLWLLWAEEILHLVTHFIFPSLQKLFTLSTDVTSSEQIKLCRKRSLKQIISCLL